MMNMRNYFLTLLLALAIAGFGVGLPGCGESDPHAGHDHSPHAEDEAEDDGHDHSAHAEDEVEDDGHDHSAHVEDEAEDDGHDHAAHAEDEVEDDGHDHAAESAQVVRLSTQQAKRFGIELAKAGGGQLDIHVRLPGEVVMNEDRAAHIVPLAPGIVRQVVAAVGDQVTASDTLAVIESSALSDAKVDHLTQVNELGCCSMDLTRAEAIRDNTAALLNLLDSNPALDALNQVQLEMGQNRSKLVIAYAELVFARAAYDREKRLAEQNISSMGDLQAAESAYKKSYATYMAQRDSIAFESQRTMLEAQRSRRNTELAVKAAEQKLRLLGLSDAEIQKLQASPNKASDEDCTDPDCADCKAKAAQAQQARDEANRNLGHYSLRAPFAGTIIQKHLTLGERVSGESNVFTIADLSTVWVNLSAFQKDLPLLAKGQKVVITAGGGQTKTAEIAFVSPQLDPATRTGLVRVVLQNPGGKWRPGSFVSATIEVGEETAKVLIPKDAVQTVAGEPVVFIRVPDGFVSQPVTTGRTAGKNVEITSGLHPGDQYVAKGAFALKAKIVTSGLDPHAGHGH